MSRHALAALLVSVTLAGCSSSAPPSETPAPAPAPAPASETAAPSPASPAPSPEPSAPASASKPAGPKSSGGKHATIVTNQGPIDIEFFEDAQPKAVENFRLLAERGYYKGVTFHRVVKGFMIQGGDPTGTGAGGESAWGRSFPDEIDRQSALYGEGYKRGIVAMANAGPNTNGSQFFIMHMDYALPPNYVIFAKVTSGMATVDRIAETPTGPGGDGAMSKPLTPIVINSVTIKP